MRHYRAQKQSVKKKNRNSQCLAFKLREALQQDSEMLHLLDLSVHEIADEAKRTALCFIVGLSYYDECQKVFSEIDQRFLAKLYILAEGNPLFSVICLSRIFERAVLSETYKENSRLLYLGEQGVQDAEMVDAQNLLSQSVAHLYEQMSCLCHDEKRRQYIEKGIAALKKISQNRPEAILWCRQLKERIEEDDHGL